MMKYRLIFNLKKMKIVLNFFILISLSLINYTTLAVTHENCNTGIYSAYYNTVWSCNTCWYHNFRFYRGNTYWLWDFFENVQAREYLISTNNAYSYAKIHNIQANVNHTLENFVGENTSWLTANWIPNTAWINWNRDTVIFAVNNVSWNQNITNRNIPIWIVEYNIRHYEVTPSWTATADTIYVYLNWTESVWANWLLTLNHSWVNSSWVKNYNPTPLNHKECYVMLPAWCWDGVIDSTYWEICDLADASQTWWWDLWCSASCQPLNSSSSSSWWWGSSSSSSSSSSWWWGSSICWDGILQRPNTWWIMEECDFWPNYSTWPAWCSLPTSSNPCEILENTTPWGLTDSNGSIPSWWTILLSPNGNILIWHNMWVFEYLSSNNVYIQNNSTSDIFIDKKICVYKNDFEYNSLSWNNICSSDNIWFLSKNWWRKNLYISDDRFVWNILNFPESIKYVDGEIITTLEWFKDINTFLKSNLKVRIAKPSINNFWWWASFLNWTNFSDVNILSSWWFALLRPELNRNLVLASLWINPLSSYTKTVNNNEILDKSKIDWENDLKWFENVKINISSNNINTLPIQNFNWLENVFIHKWNVILPSITISPWNKTYIIEDWNLIINGNIISNNNILFVVRNGNIIIKNNVTRIDAILINIWWNIVWEADFTLNTLLINGALYGNVENLLSKRTYIKDVWEYVNVWTNVFFTSKIFDSPPPLLSKFLWEYLDWNKIPK